MYAGHERGGEGARMMAPKVPQCVKVGGDVRLILEQQWLEQFVEACATPRPAMGKKKPNADAQAGDRDA